MSSGESVTKSKKENGRIVGATSVNYTVYKEINAGLNRVREGMM